MEIGEVAPPSPRDADLLAGLVGMVEDQHGASALSRFRRAHHAGGTCPDHHNVELFQEMLS
jgi:hypothetical protein